MIEEISNNTKTSPDGDVKKKKRPRQRNRPKNKANRVNGVSAANVNASTLQHRQQIADNLKPIGKIEEPVQNSKNCLKSTKVVDMNSVVPDIATPAEGSQLTNASEIGKTREQILAEREAKKLAKQSKKNKVPNVSSSIPNENLNSSSTSSTSTVTASSQGAQSSKSDAALLQTSLPSVGMEKPREIIKAEREAKKHAKQSAKAAKSGGGIGTADSITASQSTSGMQPATIVPPASDGGGEAAQRPILEKKPALTKAERRAIQEAQRAAKAQSQGQAQKPQAVAKATITIKPTSQPIRIPTMITQNKPTMTPQGQNNKFNDCKVKLFNHLESAHKDVSLFVNNSQIHAAIVRLGEQYANRTVVGSNARCIAFLNALKMVIQDFETPAKKEFARSLETSIKSCVEHLQKCRPLAVSVTNAYKHMKHVLTQLPVDKPESELKENLCHFIDTYIENQIGKAAQAISSSMQEKITDGDVILTFGCSSLINYICEEAHRRHVNFRIIVVDSRPSCEGQELLRRLTAKEIPCTYVLINAIGFVMPEATKVLLGAHALLANGYVMARAGTAQVALVAHSYNVPVLVCCETHKFSERFQTDAIVYNELGNPDELILNDKCCLTNWQSKGKISPLNLIYDITPPELVTAVVTEVSILPCTSVPVILRIKPTEIGYYS